MVQRKRGDNGWYGLVVVLLVIILAAVIYIGFFYRSTVEGQVVGFSWARVAQEQEFRVLNQDGMEYSIPHDARNISRCGVIPLGRIVAAKSCWEVDRWVNTFQHPTSNQDHSPYWATVTLPESKRLVPGAENYWVNLQTTDGVISVSLPQNLWFAIEIGDWIRVFSNFNATQVSVELLGSSLSLAAPQGAAFLCFNSPEFTIHIISTIIPPMLQHSLTTLSMGLPVVTVPMPSVKSVTVLVLVNTGSRYEKPKEEGIAHFFEHMVFKGTAKFEDAQSLASVVDSVGADFNAFTSKEYTGYYVKSASKNIRLALDVVSDMLLTPKLRQEDIDREKGVIIEEINMYADSPARHINELFDRMMFKGSGLGHDIIGTKKTVSKMTTADFTQFLKQWYGHGNMLLVLAGDASVLTDPATFELADEMFSKDTGEERIIDKVKLESYLPKHPLAHERLHLEYKKTEQAHFVLGWPAVDRKSPARYALSVLSTVLGGNMSSRLFSEVREKRGLSYYIHADTDLYHDIGLFGASAGVDPHRVEEALKVTIDEFRTVASGKKPITDDEMKKAKDYIAGKMVLGFEDSENVAQYYGMRQLLTDVLESPEEILKKIRAVTQEEIQQIANQLVIDGELRLAVIGPFKERKLFEDILAS